MTLMQSMRESIKRDEFPEFVQQFMSTLFPTKEYPAWAVESLESVNIKLH